MRHTRTREMFNRKQRKSLGGYKKNYPIEYVRNKMVYTLDPTFKWHRGGTYMSWVEFKPNPKETRLIPTK